LLFIYEHINTGQGPLTLEIATWKRVCSIALPLSYTAHQHPFIFKSVYSHLGLVVRFIGGKIRTKGTGNCI
jgi:hypothetical protein